MKSVKSIKSGTKSTKISSRISLSRKPAPCRNQINLLCNQLAGCNITQTEKPEEISEETKVSIIIVIT